MPRKDPAERKEYASSYYRAHATAVKERVKTYAKNNSALVKGRAAAYRSRNASRIAATNKAWRTAHPEQCKKYSSRVEKRYGTLRANANKRGIACPLTFDQYASLEGKPCHYCGWSRALRGGGLDREHNDRGYTVDNVLPCCSECNLARNNRFSATEMLVIGKAICRVKCDRLLRELGAIP